MPTTALVMLRFALLQSLVSEVLIPPPLLRQR